ncbi:adenosylcobinamide amidohydrolase [Micromonospora sp. NPDC000207]|uniref:adenosylcobinamide amidohydrolase n=1 Tax=Micromonospora sp. NPDC000207 TaxID=3154246 RepID=UPI0033235499
MLNEPVLTTRVEDGRELPLLVWRAGRQLRTVSSGPLGGGLGVRGWVLNATVPMSYHRDDPAAHLAALADSLDLDGPGVGLLTGVDVADVVTRTDCGVQVWATVGLGLPLWAAAPTTGVLDTGDPSAAVDAVPAPVGAGSTPGGTVDAVRPPVGTVNIVAYVPVRLTDAALVNSVATATEAKAQAIIELGRPGTGTPTDAVTVLCPVDGPSAEYGGPRSRWGAPLARAVHAAVRSGGVADRPPWSSGKGARQALRTGVVGGRTER